MSPESSFGTVTGVPTVFMATRARLARLPMVSDPSNQSDGRAAPSDGSWVRSYPLGGAPPGAGAPMTRGAKVCRSRSAWSRET